MDGSVNLAGPEDGRAVAGEVASDVGGVDPRECGERGPDEEEEEEAKASASGLDRDRSIRAVSKDAGVPGAVATVWLSEARRSEAGRAGASRSSAESDPACGKSLACSLSHLSLSSSTTLSSLSSSALLAASSCSPLSPHVPAPPPPASARNGSGAAPPAYEHAHPCASHDVHGSEREQRSLRVRQQSHTLRRDRGFGPAPRSAAASAWASDPGGLRGRLEGWGQLGGRSERDGCEEGAAGGAAEGGGAAVAGKGAE